MSLLVKCFILANLFPLCLIPFIPKAERQGFEVVEPVVEEQPVIVAVEPVVVTQDLYDIHFGDVADEARAIAQCESGQVADRHNYNPRTKDDSWGLFQINLWGNNKKNRPAPEVLVVAEENIKYAKTIYDNAGGWSRDWVNCSRKLNLK